MAKIEKSPSTEQIKKKKQELENKIDLIIESKRMGRSSQAKSFLHEIQDVIKKAIDNGVSYSKLSAIIDETYGYKISEQTIRKFALTVLGIEKKPKGVRATNLEKK